MLASLRLVEAGVGLPEELQAVEDRAVVGHARALAVVVGEVVVALVLRDLHLVFDEARTP